MKRLVWFIALLLSARLAAEEPTFARGCDLAGSVSRDELAEASRLLATLSEVGGKSEPVGLGGLQGHRVGSKVRLRLALADAKGVGPKQSAVVTLGLTGAAHGTVALPGGSACESLRFRWHESIRSPNEVIELTLGTRADLAGVKPDEHQVGSVIPVWGSTETLKITSGESSFPGRVEIHPTAGPPVKLVWSERGPQPSNYLQLLTRYGRSGHENRAIFPGLYRVADVHGNTTPEPFDVQATASSRSVVVHLARDRPERGEGLFSASLVVDWRPGSDGRWPDGSVLVTLADPKGSRAIGSTLTLDFISGRFFSLSHAPGLEPGDSDTAPSGSGRPVDFSIVNPRSAKETPGLGLVRTPLLALSGTDLPSGPFREGASDARLVRDSSDAFDVSLRDEEGVVAADATIEVALCPRAAACGAVLVSSIGELSAVRLDANAYLGLMVRRAPAREGRYFWEVAPAKGSRRPWRLNGQRDMRRTRILPAVRVSTLEFLDESLRRGPLTVDQPVLSYIHFVSGEDEGPQVMLLAWTGRQDGRAVTPETPVTAWRIGTTHDYLAAVTVSDDLDVRSDRLAAPLLRVGWGSTSMFVEVASTRAEREALLNGLLVEATHALTTLATLYHSGTRLEAYRIDNSRFPAALTSTDLIAALSGYGPLRRDFLEDAWGTPFRYEVTPEGEHYRLLSAGADLVFEKEVEPGDTDDPDDDQVLADGELVRRYRVPRLTPRTDLGPALRELHEAEAAWRRITSVDPAP